MAKTSTLDQVLARAMTDVAFRRQLLAGPDAVLRTQGYALKATERARLDAFRREVSAMSDADTKTALEHYVKKSAR